jgi:hypothetical protein
MIKCDKCPCLQHAFVEEGNFIVSEWWVCGVDESDLTDRLIPRRDVKVKWCPITEIRYEDGTAFRPEVVYEPFPDPPKSDNNTDTFSEVSGKVKVGM